MGRSWLEEEQEGTGKMDFAKNITENKTCLEERSGTRFHLPGMGLYASDHGIDSTRRRLCHPMPLEGDRNVPTEVKYIQ